MDPTNTAVIARLRTETSNSMKILKRQCEIILEDLELSLEEKKTKVMEKIYTTLLTVP